MDGRRFDAWARTIADGAGTRRWALRLVVGAGLVAVGGPTATAARTRKRRVDPRCRNKKAVNSAEMACNPPDLAEVVCDEAANCLCARTVRGDRACVKAEDVICFEKQCGSNGDCADGEVCVDIEACCPGGPPSRLCATKCPKAG